MQLIRKLTFLLIILTLAFSPVMASAAEMQNCPHMSGSADQGDIPCHPDMDVKKADTTDAENNDMANMDCGDNCQNCQCMSGCSMFLTPAIKTGHYQGNGHYVPLKQNLKSVAPEALRHPPKSFS